jgi:hypothetical protein
MIYQLVRMLNGSMIEERSSENNVFAFMSDRGFPFEGKHSPTYLREELRNKPRFRNLHGPMHGGKTESGESIARYESIEAYEVLSR